MIRGLHYTAWYRDMANYHPALPMKRMQMVEDIADMEGTVLIWSCMGSAGIGLPFLDKEINEPPPPRLRADGFLSDTEFAAECAERGITVYGVVGRGPCETWRSIASTPAPMRERRTAPLFR
jgi:hypothetical protein